MYSKIPSIQMISQNREKLKKMLGDEYLIDIKRTIDRTLRTVETNELQVDDFILKMINNIKLNRKDQMLFLDAYSYMTGVEIVDSIHPRGTGNSNEIELN